MDFQPMRCSKRTFACPTLVGGHGAWVGVEFASQELGCQSLVKEIVRNTIPKASGSQIKFFTQKESSTDEIDPSRYTGGIVAKYKSIAQYANVWVRCFGKRWYSFLYN